jgi:hypothetical protein
MLRFDALGLLGVLAVFTCWSLAIVLLRFASNSAVARMLAYLLVVEGVTLASNGYVDMLLTPPVRAHPGYASWLHFEEMVHTIGDCAMLALYPPFLGMALQTRLTRRLAHRPVRVALAALAAVLFVAVFTTPLVLGAATLYLLVATLFSFALVASIQAWRGAETAATRARARSFTVAFGFRDICWTIAYGGAIWLIFAGNYTITETSANDALVAALTAIYACGTLFYVPLVTYGILRTHLFDIDLRVRWTIKQSTVAAAVVAIVYLVSEGASQLLSTELGGVAGLFAAALVVFFMAPLQRFADRVASAAMPNTVNTPEYAAFRKLQVYEAAVAESLQGGGITPKERALLNRLRDSLGITLGDAAAVEREFEAASFASGST